MDRSEIKRKLERTLSQNKIVVPKNEETKPFVASTLATPPVPAPAIIGTGGLGPTALGETKKEEKISTNVDNEVVPTLSKIYPNVENRDRSLTNRDIKVGLDNNKVDALKNDQVEADNNRTIIYLLSCFNCFNR